MYIFNSFSYLLHSYNPSFCICLCFNMVSFRDQKKLGLRPDRSPLAGLIQNFRRASPPLSYAEYPLPEKDIKNYADRERCYPSRLNILRDLQDFSHRTKAEFNTCFIIHSKYFYVLKMLTSA